MDKDNILVTASSVSRVNKGRVQELGRGSCSKNLLQSPSVQELGRGSCPKSMLQSPGAQGSSSDGTSALNLALSEQVKVEVLELGKADNTGPTGSDTADHGQQDTKGGLSGVQGLNKNQRRKLRKKEKVAAAAAAAAAASSSHAGGKAVGVKRPRPTGSTPSPSTLPSVKKSREEPIQGKVVQSRREVQLREDDQPGEDDPTLVESCPSFSQAVRTVKIAIVKRDFPRDKLSMADTDAILLKILELTDSIPDGEWMPEIFSNNLLKGALILMCGVSTVDWIRSNFEGLKLGNLTLKVLSADELPKPVKVAFKSKEKFSEQNVLLRRIQRFNPMLKATEWRVLQRVAGSSTTRWIFEVDPDDAEAIVRAGCGVFTGVDRGTFKIIHDPNKRRTVAEGVTEGTPMVTPEVPGNHSDTEEMEHSASSLVAEEDLLASPSSRVSTTGTTEDLNLLDLQLDTGSETTLQPDSPQSTCDLDEALKVLEEKSSPQSSQKG